MEFCRVHINILEMDIEQDFAQKQTETASTETMSPESLIHNEYSEYADNVPYGKKSIDSVTKISQVINQKEAIHYPTYPVEKLSKPLQHPLLIN